MRSQKLIRIKEGLSDLVSVPSLINSLFQDIPELQTFSWSYTQEYDDSNYNDYSRLLSVNGYSVDYDGDYEEEEEESGKNLPKLEKEDILVIMSVVRQVSSTYGYQDEFTVDRPSDESLQMQTEDEGAFEKYLKSFVSGRELPETFFTENECDLGELAEIATYYAMDHGRFSPQVEFKIFAKEGIMFRAYRYAQHVIGGSLPEDIENFFVINDTADGEDHKWLVKYLSFKKRKKRKSSS